MQDFYNELEEYIDILFNKPQGLEGRKYLKSRGITKATAEYWKLGYCPVGYIPKVYNELSKDTEFYRFWEKMWGGLIIPIFDQNGKIVSISRRLLVKIEGKPKYDHYPFNARKVLFGLYQNKYNIREVDRAIITEGQFDVITAWQSGVQIVTSSFGAHGSLDHFAVLSRYASTIDILYDEDTAGKIGTDSIKEFPTWGDLEVNLKTNIFPYGEDLDSWIRKHSAEELFSLLNKDKTDYLKKKLRILKNR